MDELIEHGADDLSQAALSVLEADEARFIETADAVDLPADLSDGIRSSAGEVSEAAGAFYGE